MNVTENPEKWGREQCGHDQKPVEYLDHYRNFAAPGSCGYIFEKRVHGARRAFWLCMIIVGIIHTSYMIILNADKYFSYPCSVKPSLNREEHVRFPKVTICINGMHSRRKIKEKYPHVNIHLLSELYTGSYIDKASPSGEQNDSDILSNISYDEFIENTHEMDSKYKLCTQGVQFGPKADCESEANALCLKAKRSDIASLFFAIKRIRNTNWTPCCTTKGVMMIYFFKPLKADFALLGCRYMTRGCISSWTNGYTRYGHCAQFNPDMGRIEKKTSIGRKASLSVVIGYNQSDSSIGWYHFLAGLTLYYSDPTEGTLDELYSISMPPGAVPMVSILQLKNKKLGAPYSKCVGESKNWLDYYPTYTEHQCLNECLAKTISGVCGCLPKYLSTPHYTPEFQACTLLEHAVCVSRLIKMFDYGQCGCMSACEERQPKGQIVQYGNYKDAAKIVRSSRINVENMSAAVVYLAEVRGTVHEEVPDYGSEQFLSDVGGAAGLVLGMSLTSVIGLLDLIVVAIIRYINQVSAKVQRTAFLKSKDSRRNSYEIAVDKHNFKKIAPTKCIII